MQKKLKEVQGTLTGLICILVFYLAGLAIQLLTAVPIPGSVIGMALLFLALGFFGGSLPAGTSRAGQRLISIMALLLLPPAVGIFFLPEAFNAQLPAIIGAIIIGTAISMAITALLMSRLLKAEKHPKNHD